MANDSSLLPGPGCIQWIPFSLLHLSEPSLGGECTTDWEDPSWRSLALPSSTSLSRLSKSSQMKVASSVISHGRESSGGAKQHRVGAGTGMGIGFSTGGATYSLPGTDA